MHYAKKGTTLLVAGSFLLATVGGGEAAQTTVPTQPYGVNAPSVNVFSPTSAPTPEMLEQLLAPIALYPDGLVAEILAAAAYPNEIVAADHWLQQNGDLQGAALAQAVDQRPWDASVKALVAFPSVLRNMAQNLTWTEALGEANKSEPQDVLNAVQTMRRRAVQAGTLRTGPRETVTTEGDTIGIEPADPQVVYVPEYDPWLVYGPPVAMYPYWDPYPGLYLDEPGFLFGLGIGMGMFAGFGWGWGHWGADWHHGWLLHDQHAWGPMAGRGFNPGDRGFAPGGAHGFAPGGGFRPGAVHGFDPAGARPADPAAVGHAGPVGAGHAGFVGTEHAGPVGAGHAGPVGVGQADPAAGHPAVVAGHEGSAGGFHSGGFAAGGFHPDVVHAGGFHPGGFAAGGFHPDVVHAGGFHPGGFAAGGFHGGGFHGGGFHGGGFHGGGFHGGGHR